MAHKVKTSKYKELADFIQHLKHKYAQISIHLHTRSRLTAEQRAMTNYQERAAEEMMNNKHAQLQLAKAEAGSKGRADPCASSADDGTSGISHETEQDGADQKAQEQDATQNKRETTAAVRKAASLPTVSPAKSHF